MVNPKDGAQMAQGVFTLGEKPKSPHGILQKEKWELWTVSEKSQFRLGGDKRKSCPIKMKAWRVR